MSARIRPEGALAAVLMSALLAVPPARAQTCAADSIYYAFNTYLGGARDDEVRDLQLISSLKGPVGSLTHDVLITGHTKSLTLPSGRNTAMGTGDNNNVFVSRLSPDGTEVRWSFLFGSEGDDSGARVAAGPAGEVYVAGRISKGTNATPASYGFPAVYLSAAGATDAFLARLSADGQPEWFLYLASTQDDEALGLAVTGDAAYVVGKTKAPIAEPFPRVPAAQSIPRYGLAGSDGNNFDAFIVKVNLKSPSTPAWSRILATSPSSNSRADDIAQAVLVQGDDVSIGGRLEGAPAMATNENVTVDAHCGAVAGMVMKLASDGKGQWISCLGGKEGGREGGTEVQALLLLPGSELLAVGDTASPDFLPPGPGTSSGRDVFAHTLASNGAWLKGLRVAAPGIQQARGRAALHPASGRVLLGGWTDTALFEGPTLSGRDLKDVFNAPDGEGFVLSLAADLARPEWGAYVGGGTDSRTQESVAAVVVDEKTGLVALAGTSSATDLMRLKTGAELKAPGLQNGFVFGLKLDSTPPQLVQGKPLEVRLDERGRLEASWKDTFTDPESGISSYEWSAIRESASSPEFTRPVTGDQAQAQLTPNERYTVQVKATNGVGCTTVLSQLVGEGTPIPGAPQSPLGWTCGVTDPGAASLGALSLVALLRLVPRSRRRANRERARPDAPSA